MEMLQPMRAAQSQTEIFVASRLWEYHLRPINHTADPPGTLPTKRPHSGVAKAKSCSPTYENTIVWSGVSKASTRRICAAFFKACFVQLEQALFAETHSKQRLRPQDLQTSANSASLPHRLTLQDGSTKLIPRYYTESLLHGKIISCLRI
jgi:hypothetical protein